jgi:hypothetical protein
VCLEQYAGAFGIVHDTARSGLADHAHEIHWQVSPHEQRPNGAYITIDVRLDCGCEIRDIEVFARQMREQRGWEIATSTSWGGSRGMNGEPARYSIRARRKSVT